MDTNEQVPQEEVVETEVQEVEPEAPTQEAEPSETPEAEPEAEPEEEQVAPEPEEPEAPQPSRRESMRIQQLIEKMKATEAPAAPEAPAGLDYSQALDAAPEVISQLEADRKQYGEAQFNQGLEQLKSVQFHTRLEIDQPRVESKYPNLDPNSPNFDAIATDDLNTTYLFLSGYDAKTGRVANPNLRYSEFVDSQMALAERLASKKVADSAKNIAKQVATTGLRPDGSKAKAMNLNQSPDQMTDEELAAAIAATLPKN